jgi:digeranylgeranylglycerophospholipid reductase
MMKADLVVVGGGPAGSTVAGIAASEGMDVMVLEKEREIGRSPCAGYVGSMDFPDIDPGVIQSKIKGMRTYFPSGRYRDFPINGFNVDRAQFDRELALRAEGCGAKFYMNSDVVGMIMGGKGCDKRNDSSGGYRGVRLRDGKEIKAKVIVGADGASSVISRILNFRNEAVTSVQYEVSDCEVDSEINEIYFDVKYAPVCYVWIFPTSRDSARVGLAVRSHLADKKAIDYLDDFISEHPIASKKFSGSSKTKLTAGIIPVGGLHVRICKDNVLLVGDSAGMADPITGAGISYAMTAGSIAARVVVKAIEQDDLTILGKYEGGFRRIMNRHYEKSSMKRELLDSLGDNESLEKNLPRLWVTFEEYWRT